MAVSVSSGVRQNPVARPVGPRSGRGNVKRDGAAPGDTYTPSPAAASCSIPDIPAIHTLTAVNQISDQCLGIWGADGYPSYQYQYTKTYKHYHQGYTDSYGNYQPPYYTYTYETKYNWGAAFADIRAKLQAIADTAGNTNESRCQEIAQLANNALQSNDWQYFLDVGSDQSRFAQLQATLQNINELTSNTPSEPQTTVNQMNGAIADANGAIQDLRNTLKDPTLTASNLSQKVQAKISEYNQKANNIPWWHYLLIFGFFEKAGDHGTANRLQQDLHTVQTSNPDQLQKDLNGIASQAPSIVQQACNTTTVDGATQLQSTAQPVTDAANQVAQTATGQSNQGKDLVKTLNGN